MWSFKRIASTTLVVSTLLWTSIFPVFAQDPNGQDADSTAKTHIFLPLVVQGANNTDVASSDDPTKSESELTEDESKQLCTSSDPETCDLPDSYFAATESEALALYQQSQQNEVFASATMAGTTYVGVIPASDACPSGSEKIKIHTDDEDRSNGGNSNTHGGWTGAIEVGRNTTYVFCKVSGELFKPLQNGLRYAVLSLSELCPVGARKVVRYQDNEDKRNANWSQGNIYPNVLNSNTSWVFCDFNQASPTKMNTFPNLGIGYGVFAAQSLAPGFPTGYRFSDDEDTRNANRWSPNEIASIIYDGRNTMMKLAQVSREPQWTTWFNRDDSYGSGDWETLTDLRAAGNNICNGVAPVGINCSTVTGGVDWTATGETYSCKANVGGVCQNNQQADGACQDYQVRFLCQ